MAAGDIEKLRGELTRDDIKVDTGIDATILDLNRRADQQLHIGERPGGLKTEENIMLGTFGEPQEAARLSRPWELLQPQRTPWYGRMHERALEHQRILGEEEPKGTTMSPWLYGTGRAYSQLVEKPLLHNIPAGIGRIGAKAAQAADKPVLADTFKNMADTLEQPGVVTGEVEKFREARVQQDSYDSAIAGTTTALTEAGADWMGLYAHMKFLGGFKIAGADKIDTTQKLGKLGLAKKYILAKPFAQQMGKLGAYRFMTSEGNITDRGKQALTMMAYNATPYVAGATGATGGVARIIDIGLNMAISNAAYKQLFQEAELSTEQIDNLLSTFLTDVMFAINTRGYPEALATKKYINYFQRQEAARVEMLKDVKGPDGKPIYTGRSFDEAAKYMNALRQASIDHLEKAKKGDLVWDDKNTRWVDKSKAPLEEVVTKGGRYVTDERGKPIRLGGTRIGEEPSELEGLGSLGEGARRRGYSAYFSGSSDGWGAGAEAPYLHRRSGLILPQFGEKGQPVRTIEAEEYFKTASKIDPEGMKDAKRAAQIELVATEQLVAREKKVLDDLITEKGKVKVFTKEGVKVETVKQPQPTQEQVIEQQKVAQQQQKGKASEQEARQPRRKKLNIKSPTGRAMSQADIDSLPKEILDALYAAPEGSKEYDAALLRAAVEFVKKQYKKRSTSKKKVEIKNVAEALTMENALEDAAKTKSAPKKRKIIKDAEKKIGELETSGREVLVARVLENYGTSEFDRDAWNQLTPKEQELVKAYKSKEMLKDVAEREGLKAEHPIYERKSTDERRLIRQDDKGAWVTTWYKPGEKVSELLWTPVGDAGSIRGDIDKGVWKLQGVSVDRSKGKNTPAENKIVEGKSPTKQEWNEQEFIERYRASSERVKEVYDEIDMLRAKGLGFIEREAKDTSRYFLPMGKYLATIKEGLVEGASLLATTETHVLRGVHPGFSHRITPAQRDILRQHSDIVREAIENGKKKYKGKANAEELVRLDLAGYRVEQKGDEFVVANEVIKAASFPVIAKVFNSKEGQKILKDLPPESEARTTKLSPEQSAVVNRMTKLINKGITKEFVNKMAEEMGKDTVDVFKGQKPTVDYKLNDAQTIRYIDLYKAEKGIPDTPRQEAIDILKGISKDMSVSMKELSSAQKLKRQKEKIENFRQLVETELAKNPSDPTRMILERPLTYKEMQEYVYIPQMVGAEVKGFAPYFLPGRLGYQNALEFADRHPNATGVVRAVALERLTGPIPSAGDVKFAQWLDEQGMTAEKFGDLTSDTKNIFIDKFIKERGVSVPVGKREGMLPLRQVVSASSDIKWGDFETDGTLDFGKADLLKDSVSEFLFLKDAVITPTMAEKMVPILEGGIKGGQVLRQVTDIQKVKRLSEDDLSAGDSAQKRIQAASIAYGTEQGRRLAEDTPLQLTYMAAGARRIANALNNKENITVGQCLEEVYRPLKMETTEEFEMAERFDAKKTIDYWNERTGFFRGDVTPSTRVSKDIFKTSRPMRWTGGKVAEVTVKKVVEGVVKQEKRKIQRGKQLLLDIATKKGKTYSAVSGDVVKEGLDAAVKFAATQEIYNKVLADIGPGTKVSQISKPLIEHLLKIAATEINIPKDPKTAWETLKYWVPAKAASMRAGLKEISEVDGKAVEISEKEFLRRLRVGQARQHGVVAEAVTYKTDKNGKIKKYRQGHPEQGQPIPERTIKYTVEFDSKKNKIVVPRLIGFGDEATPYGKKRGPMSVANAKDKLSNQYNNVIRLINLMEQVIDPSIKGLDTTNQTIRMAEQDKKEIQDVFGLHDIAPVKGPSHPWDSMLKDEMGYEGDSGTEMAEYGAFIFPKFGNIFRNIHSKDPYESGLDARDGKLVNDVTISKIMDMSKGDVAWRDVLFRAVRNARVDSAAYRLMGQQYSEEIFQQAKKTGIAKNRKEFDEERFKEWREAMQQIQVVDPRNPMEVMETDFGVSKGMDAWNRLPENEKRLVAAIKAQWKAMAIDGVAEGLWGKEILNENKIGYAGPRRFVDNATGETIAFEGKVKAQDFRRTYKDEPWQEAERNWAGAGHFDWNPIRMLENSFMNYAGLLEGRRLLRQLTFTTYGTDKMLMVDGKPAMLSVDEKGQAYFGDSKDKYEMSGKELKEAGYTKLSGPLASDANTSMFNYRYDGQPRSAWLHPEAYKGMAKDLANIYTMTGSRMPAGLKAIKPVVQMTKFAAFWNPIWPGWNAVNTYLFAMTPFPFAGTPVVRRVAPLLAMPLTILYGAARGIVGPKGYRGGLLRSAVAGLGEATPAGLAGFTGLLAAGITGLGPAAAVVSAIGAGAVGKILGNIKAGPGEVRVNDVMPFLKKVATPYHVRLEMAKNGFSTSSEREFIRKLSDNTVDTFEKGTTVGNRAFGALQDLVTNKLGLTKALWTAVENAAAQAYGVNKAFFQKYGADEATAGRLSAYGLTYAFGLPEERMNFSADDMLRFVLAARNSQISVWKQLSGQAMGSFGFGPKAFQLGRGTRKTGHFGFTKDEAKLLTSFFYRQQTGQAFIAAFTAGVLSYLLSGYFPWEREEKTYGGKVPDLYKIFDIGTGVVGKDGREILITPPIFKDARDTMAMLMVPYDVTVGNKGVSRYVRNKMGLALRGAIEIPLNLDISTMQPITPAGGPPYQRAVDAVKRLAEQYTPLGSFVETEFNIRREPWERQMAMLGVRTRRSLAGSAPEAELYGFRRGKIQQYEYKREKAFDKMDRAYFSGDMETFVALAKQYYVSARQFKEYLYRKKHKLRAQWERAPKRVRPSLLRR